MARVKDVTHKGGAVSGTSQSSVSSKPQVMKQVVIPASSSSLGSPLSSDHDQSSQSDTPATSVAVTPAELLPKRLTRRSLAPAAESMPLKTKGKRKRTAADDLLEADELLAQSLQETEWKVDNALTPATKRQRFASKALIVEDSSLEGDFSLDESASKADASDSQTSYIQSQIHRESPRSRKATRAAASSKVQRETQRHILDTDESELSDISDESAFTVEDEDADDSEDSVDQQNNDHNSVHTVNDSADEANRQAASVASGAAVGRRNRQRSGRRGNARGRRRTNLWGSRAERERQKLEKAHPEILHMWETLKAVPKIQPQEAAQPSTITRKLKSFQLEGLDWMTKQEASQWKGGLLGDEMGMGKTIQAVSLVMSDYPARDPTLVVVPPVALMQWQNEIGQYTDGKLKVLVYHNTNPKVKNLKVKDLRAFDVIMISYSGLESIYRKESKGWKRDDGLVKENSKIHAIHYHRLILDEAHNIKTRTTSVAKACFALKADFKWCLSGTPVQNRIGEFFSLLRFLQITPFASYFCKKCPCAELHWNQDSNKRCSSCHHTGFEHVSIFNQELLNPITQQGDPELRREALQKLRLVTDRIMLRRMKRDHTASMELPPKEVIIHNEFFGEIERDFSSSIMSNTMRQFDTYVSRGVMLNNYANIFGLIMQVSHPPSQFGVGAPNHVLTAI